MFNVVESLGTVTNYPPHIVLTCIVGCLAALHFASATTPAIKGARCDSVVKEAKANAIHRPAWIRKLGIGLGLSIAGGNFLYLQNPNFFSILLNNLPF